MLVCFLRILLNKNICSNPSARWLLLISNSLFALIFQFHAMVLSSRPQLLASLPKMTPSQHVSLLTRQLLQCLASHPLLQFKSSMLALAIITLELEKLCPDWLALTIDLQSKAQVRKCCQSFILLYTNKLTL